MATRVDIFFFVYHTKIHYQQSCIQFLFLIFFCYHFLFRLETTAWNSNLMLKKSQNTTIESVFSRCYQDWIRIECTAFGGFSEQTEWLRSWKVLQRKSKQSDAIEDQQQRISYRSISAKSNRYSLLNVPDASMLYAVRASNSYTHTHTCRETESTERLNYESICNR